MHFFEEIKYFYYSTVVSLYRIRARERTITIMCYTIQSRFDRFIFFFSVLKEDELKEKKQWNNNLGSLFRCF